MAIVNSISIQAISICYLALLLFVFKRKQKDHNLEGLLFDSLLWITIITIVLDLCLCALICYQSLVPTILITICGKAYLVFSIIWCLWFTIYIISINGQKGYKSLKEVFKKEGIFRFGLVITLIVAIGAVYFDSIYGILDSLNIAYQSGAAESYVIIVSVLYHLVILVYLLINPKKITLSQKLPIFFLIIIELLSILLQSEIHTEILSCAIMAFVMQFIYFNMEKPDDKILKAVESEKEKFESASKAKTDFLSNMSHDIRTPMNAIIGFSESLLMEQLNPDQKSEVQNIYDASCTLLNIINNILDISRIESGKEVKTEKPYELRKIIMQLTSVITSKLDNSKIRFNVQIDKSVPTHFIGDELKVYQILMNILSNAVKYTEEGHIDFIVSSTMENEKSLVKFVISDTGIGIKKEDFDKMFVKFSRLHNEENYKEIEGTGLGLAITKNLIELLGGTITFESEFGKGTSFAVTIPQSIYKVSNQAETANVLNRTASASHVHFDGSLYDVLVVDDNSLNLKVAQRILSDYNFNITLANSGDECINLVKSGKRFDVIFLDHMMPIKDGIQTLHELKAIQGVKIPPIVALTANAMVGMKEMYLNAGFDGYISKPINREELQNLLNNFFTRSN